MISWVLRTVASRGSKGILIVINKEKFIKLWRRRKEVEIGETKN